MSWLNNPLTRLFRRASRPTTQRDLPTRFRPALLPLEDRTVPAGADAFADATVITSSFYSDISDNTTATGEEGESALFHANGEINSLWWKWTAPASGQYEVNTFGSLVDTRLGVYTGSSIGDLVEVASNDNDPDTGSSQSRVAFDAIEGETYYFGIDGNGSPDTDVVAVGEI